MLFRNFTLFRLPKNAIPSTEALEKALQEKPLRHAGPYEMSTQGAVKPFGDGDDRWVVERNGALLWAVGREDKILPASVVNTEVKERVQKLAEEEGRPVGKKERKTIKEKVIDEFLPRAFSRQSRVWIYLDTQTGWIVVDTTSLKTAENALSFVRELLGSFPAVPVSPNQPPRQVFTSWLKDHAAPSPIIIADSCELREPGGSESAVVKCKNQNLDSDEIAENLRQGKQATQIALAFDDRLGFTLTEGLQVKKLQFFDIVADQLDGDSESESQEMDARFTIMVGEIRPLIAKMETLFEIEPPEEVDSEAEAIVE